MWQAVRNEGNSCGSCADRRVDSSLKPELGKVRYIGDVDNLAL